MRRMTKNMAMGLLAATVAMGTVTGAVANQLRDIKWKKIEGKAHDISVGGEKNVAWKTGGAKVGGGYEIFRYGNKEWQKMTGEGLRIDVGPDGVPWMVNASHDIYKFAGGPWTKMPGKAIDVGIGKGGSVWVIGTIRVNGGYSIHRWTNNKWERIPGGALRIDVGPDGNAWVVNDKGFTFRYTGTGWTRLPGPPARDIGVGANGTVWIVDREQLPYGGRIWRFEGHLKGWARVNGQLTNITVDSKGSVWGRNKAGDIYAHPRSPVFGYWD